ncbi:TonB-linked outer membrane protein, SusC/RagA family [Galbibacter orientalis DSM 19592]|uniref:TonB-linked outer membrane protein, SusC/RagA family n=1 Tax=Galbibacter orientalis DSM 19592 TaxID=926559 RepID=I3C1H9_9FLAO|nr:TonB-dependent receptor [Galbibacter orientalis]EIJ37472.1 TonB-linked outer membrane protein, SusC/RagA family [Galbibacter orientalis DSM 19592]
MKHYGVLFFCLLISMSIWSQQMEVRGTITSEEDQMPLPGVTVIVKGTEKGTVTDFDGNYSLSNVNTEATLVMSYIGFSTVEIPINGSNAIDIAMKIDAQQLDEVVLTGYTTQKKADITGAVSVVDIDEMSKQPQANPIQAMQGRVAGVKITSDGSPSGGNTRVLIRGVGTLNNLDPLYIIDGIPTKSGMQELNPNDIASIQVLKDAASASIYGSRASNGVIVITTKTGKHGKMRVNFQNYTSFSQYANRQDVLDVDQYGQVLWQAMINDGIDPNTNNLSYQFDWSENGGNPVLNNIMVPEYLDGEKTLKSANTDWYDEISRLGIAQSYNLSVSNGSEKGNYLLSLGYYDNEGIIKETNFNRISARMNSSYKLLNGKLTIGENFTINRTEEVSDPGVLDPALRALPIIPVRTIDGKGWGGPVGGMNDRQNPVRLLEYNKDNGYEFQRIFGNVYIDVEPIENLHVKTNLGIDQGDFYKRTLQRSYVSGYLRNDQNAVTIDQNKTDKITWSNTATYDLTLDKHQFNVLVGTELYREKFESTYLRREDFLLETPEYMYPDAGTGESFTGGSATGYSLVSFFGKLAYDFDARYLFSATIRRDGSSRFGANNRFGTFPAFSAGWRISNESFMKNSSLISDLKLRLGWGQTGNQEIDNNAIYSLYIADYAGGNPTWETSYGTAYDLAGAGSGLLPSGFRAIQIGNDDLKWETTTQTNVGLDFGFFEQRLSGSLDLYYKETEDILVLPPYLGAIGEGGNRWVNGASMENKGIELALLYRGGNTDGLTYELSGNFALNRNKITYLPIAVQNNYGGNGTDDNILGRAINSMYGYVTDGLFKTEEELQNSAEQQGKGLGRIRYKDLNSDGVIDDQDRDWIGNPNPSFTYGLNLSFGYKQFDLNLFFDGVGDVDVINSRKYQTDFWSVDDVGSNKGTRLLNAWSPNNPDSDIPALTTIDNNAESRFSTYYIEPGDYFKLRNLQIGYTLPQNTIERIGVSKIRFYTGGQNLFTINSKKFTGIDPENPAFGYPLPFTVTIGMNLTF